MNKELLRDADISALPETGRIVVGFSGGADSTALLYYLALRLGRERLLAAHVNHLLRGEEAERDEEFARLFCERHGIPFQAHRVDVRALAKERGKGLEECGRSVRYAFFESLCKGGNDRIATAHNADDNAETMLLNLCRGASLQGLCGIPVTRGRIVRPLLRVGRGEIERFCRENGLSYVTDSSNLGTDYARNKIRLLVAPVLRELNPAWVEAAAQTARSLERDRDFIRQEAEKLLVSARCGYGLSAQALLAAHESVRSAAVKRWLEEQGCGRLEKKHVEKVLELLEAGGGATLPGGLDVRAAQGILSAGIPEDGGGFCVAVLEQCTRLPCGKTLILHKKMRPDVENTENGRKINNLLFKNSFDYDTITGTIHARSRRPGDRFSPAGRHVTKSLKQIFEELRIPARERGSMVLLETGGELLFCEGAGVSERFRVTEQTKILVTVQIE